MTWTALDTWIVVVGALGAASCALLGNFLLLRRLSMMGDAISHAVLPGLAAAFLLTQSRANWPMFLGAAFVGVLTAAFTQWIHSLGKVDEGASMGVVFTFLFAVGLILIVRAADAVDLDPGCVLYGAIELTPLDTVSLFGVSVPRAVLAAGATLVGNGAIVLLFFKELRLTAFDPVLGTTLGFNAGFFHYLLVTLVAMTTVACFESIGSILVIAMLIVPPAAAHLLTDRLRGMILISMVFAVTAAIGGHIAAITVPVWFGFTDTSTAGMMAVVAGVLFSVVLLLAPRHGVLSKFVRQTALSLRIVREDLLGLLFRLEEFSGAAPLPTNVPAVLHKATGSGPVWSRLALWSLYLKGHVDRLKGSYRLTPLGAREARGLVRSHRLWESYAAKHFGLPIDHVHLPAARVEHYISGAMREEIARDLENALLDPHGHPIPRRDGPEGGAASQYRGGEPQ